MATENDSAPRWPYYPVFLTLQDQPVVLVGGGDVGLRKWRLLRRAGAQVRIISRELHPELAAAVAAGESKHLATDFDPAHLNGARLVVAATDDAQLNQSVAAAATAAGIPVNVVDDPQHSSFITPSIIDRAPVLIAISTAGDAPVLARRLREQFEALLPARFGALAQFMGRWREQVRARIAAPQRRTIWEAFLDGAGAQQVLNGNEAQAQDALNAIIDGQPASGEVYLVGAGPGDPDLLTLRALRLMQQADVVLYDALVHAEILELVRRDADRIFVGKRKSNHTLPQDEINLELVRLAQAGKRVLRLKGGDPFIFGRGGEEIETLAAHGVAFQVVPGITAASGCSAYAGIPLTHRDHAQSCVFVTGHPRKGGELELAWDTLARPGQTVVIYMGLGSLPDLCARLIEAGLPADWPAAVVEHGTSAQQRVVASDLARLPDEVQRAEISGPSLVIVGQVVKLREKLNWFQRAGRSSPS